MDCLIPLLGTRFTPQREHLTESDLYPLQIDVEMTRAEHTEDLSRFVTHHQYVT